jgi:hypothetical protein
VVFFIPGLSSDVVLVPVVLPVVVDVSPVPEVVGALVWQEVNSIVAARNDVNDSFTNFIGSKLCEFLIVFKLSIIDKCDTKLYR